MWLSAIHPQEELFSDIHTHNNKKEEEEKVADLGKIKAPSS
jgi:hypothetical protein